MTDSTKGNQKKEFDKLFDSTLDKVVEYSDHLIKDHIKENKLSLTNGFDVIFRDRKRKREMTETTKRKLCPQCNKKRNACDSEHCREKPHCWLCGTDLK